MVRTKADRVPTKAVGSKAPHKLSSGSTPSKKAAGAKGRTYAGGNPAHPRETPEWQKPITFFLNPNSSNDKAAGVSSIVNDDESLAKKTTDADTEDVHSSETETD